MSGITKHTEAMSKHFKENIEIKDITERQLKKFQHVRESGKINMTDIVKGSKLIGESEEVYECILWNFNQIKARFI